MTTRSVPVSSSTAITSATNSPGTYASPPAGRPDAPFPRPSNVITRWSRANAGTCAFQRRLCTIDQVGSSTTVVGWSSPNTSKAVSTLSRTTIPRRSGSRALIERPPVFRVCFSCADSSAVSIIANSAVCPESNPLSRSTSIPRLNVITSDTTAAVGNTVLSTPSSSSAGVERGDKDLVPLGEDAGDASTDFGRVPADRLELQEDLLVPGVEVLRHEVTHRGTPLLDEGHVRGIHRALPFGEPRRETLERLEHDLLHRPEVVVDQPVIHPGFLGDPSRREREMTFADQQRLRGVEDGRGDLAALATFRSFAPRTHRVRVPQPQRCGSSGLIPRHSFPTNSWARSVLPGWKRPMRTSRNNCSSRLRLNAPAPPLRSSARSTMS